MNQFSTFYEWLEKQKSKKSPLGDLAGKLTRDEKFPKDLASLDALLAYLKESKAAGMTLATARIAWQTYTRSNKE